MKIGTHETHPAADLFPLMTGDEFDKLVADVKERGLIEPIWLDADDLVLDGRNRYRACVAAKVEPAFRRYEGDDCILFVASQNLRRRHLTAKQRAKIAAALARLPPHRPSRSTANQAVTQSEAAALMNVSRDSVQRAARDKRIAEQAVPELAAAVSDAISVDGTPALRAVK